METESYEERYEETGLADIGDIKDMFLSFFVQEEEYAVNITHVHEIVTRQKIIPVPDVPYYIKGVINLRGKVIPVMDIRLRFGLEEKEYTDRTCTIVMEFNETPAGIIVDQVNEVLEFGKDKISPPPRVKKDSAVQILKGMGKRDEEDGMCMLLNVENLLYSEKEDIKSTVSQIQQQVADEAKEKAN